MSDGMYEADSGDMKRTRAIPKDRAYNPANQSATAPAPTIPAIPRKQKRKTIHICSSLDSVGKYLVLAVCDDGSIWSLDGLYLEEKGKGPYWEPFPIPPND